MRWTVRVGWVTVTALAVAAGPGCWPGTRYIPVYPGDLAPDGCTKDDGTVAGRQVPIGVSFWPAPGVTDYVVWIGFDVLDPATGDVEPGWRLAAPVGSQTVNADGSLAYRYYGCADPALYRVTAFIWETAGSSSNALFEEECDGELTWTGNDSVRWAQATAADPLLPQSCFDP